MRIQFRQIGWLVIGAIALSHTACSRHIAEYEPKRRDYRPPVNFQQANEAINKGSIFNPTYPGTYLFADQRAMRLGDIVTVRIKEEADAKRGAGTELSRKSETQLELDAFFGVLNQLDNEQLKNGNLLDALFDSEFAGSGKTSRSESMEATVPATVRNVLPNGNHRRSQGGFGERRGTPFLSEWRDSPRGYSGGQQRHFIGDCGCRDRVHGTWSHQRQTNQRWLNRSLDYVSPF